MICVYFNPRSHERSDRLFNVPYSSDHISIHASTRGATEKGELENILGVFQSTLPREERRSTCYSTTDHINFNPRFHERSDAVEFFQVRQSENFNPRFHERSDFSALCVLLFPPEFQSTLPREERHKRLLQGYKLYNISIHASTRGATNALMHDVCNVVISIHASTRGATKCCF